MFRRVPRRQRPILIGSLLYALTFTLSLLVHPGTPRCWETFDDIWELIAPWFACACGLAHAWLGRRGASARWTGWLLIALGCASWAVGDTFWTYYEEVAHTAPFPSGADAGYLGASALILCGVTLLFGVLRTAGRMRLILDSAIATSGVALLSWYFLVQRLWHQSGVSPLAKWIGVAYPLADVAALFGVLVLLGGVAAGRGLRRATILLAGGIVLEALADSLFNLYTLNQTYHTGLWLDAGWVFGWLLVGFSFLTQMWEAQEDEDAPTTGVMPGTVTVPVWRLLLPYASVIAAFSFVASRDYMDDRRISTATLMQGMGLILLVVARQVFTLMENRHLTDRLRAFSEGLEVQVQQRTLQLSALLRLTNAVNGTLDVAEVLSEAAAQTRQALRADTVVISLLSEGALEVALVEGQSEGGASLDFLTALPVRERTECLGLPSNPADFPYPLPCLRAPLLWQQRPVGMIGVIRRQEEFGTADMELLESIGLAMGTALGNARRFRAALDAADRDSVTNLLNHRAAHQRLDQALGEAHRREQPLAVLMIDLNNFKLFNDTYGHPIGDQVLRQVADTLQQECGTEDIVGRYGGDEFLVALPACDEAGAVALSQRLRARMAAGGFQHLGEDRTVPITLSFGIAAFPKDSARRHELLTLADINLYAAKRSVDGIIVTSETQRAHRALRAEGSFSVLDAMITSVDNKDSYTRRHSEDVTEYALWLAEEMGLSEETQRTVRVGGLLHDVGKIGVPDEILRKPGRLTAEEYEVMKRHAHLGALMVAGVPGMEFIIDAVRSHHEHWDGQGYPDALAGEDIPLLGRILAVADAFSAMTTDRPYRQGMDPGAALGEIQRHIGTQFDPALAQAFLRAARRRCAAAPALRAA